MDLALVANMFVNSGLELNGFDFDNDKGQLTLNVSEIVDVSSFNMSKFTMRKGELGSACCLL